MSKLLAVLSGHGFIMTSRPLAWAVGLNASVLLGELCSRQAQHGADFWATNEQLGNATTLSERELRGASKRLIEAGFIKVEKKGLPARNHYTVNVDALVEFFSEDVESRDLDNGGDDYSCDDQSLRNVSDQSSQNVATIGHETLAHIKNDSNNETAKTNKHMVRKEASAQRPAPSRPWNEEEGNKVAEVVKALNEETGAHYRPTSKATMRHILARLREGFTVDDCREVIRKKSEEWSGTEMAKYLRPETLFGSKFESYLNAPEDPRAKERAEKAREDAEWRKSIDEKCADWDEDIPF
nr:MAG TPA: hypothetical protein [Caudoviricetes sp.]